MKQKFVLWLLMLTAVAFQTQAQNVSIGDHEFTPNPGAILDISSSNKGVLIPRLTYVQRMYISTNAQSTGLLVYQTDNTPGFYYFDGLTWKFLSPQITSGGEDPSGFATVAYTGSYTDLKDKPTIPTRLQDLEQDENYYTTVSRAEREKWNAAASGVSFTGDYNDLSNKPTIPTRLQDLQQDENYYTTVTRAERETWNAKSNFSGSYTDLSNKPEFKSVATSGSYNDLSDKPSIPTMLRDLTDDYNHLTVTEAEKDKWNATAQVNNFSGSYNDLADKPTIPTLLSDLAGDIMNRTITDMERTLWNAKSNFSGDYNDLSNKPTIPTRLQDLQQDENYYTTVSKAEREAWNAKSSFSGDYNDLSNKPTMPSRLQDLEQDGYYRTVTDAEKSLWNAKSNFSGSYNDLSDRPNISPSATSGNYNDLINKPFIPTKLSELSDDDKNRLVTDAQMERWDSKSSFSGSYNDLENLPDLPAMVKTAINARLPIGSVIMWVGTPQNVPTGWRIMSEMVGRFPVGAGTATGAGGVTRSYAVNENQDSQGEMGKEFVTLTTDQMPSHSHSITGEKMQKDGSSNRVITSIDTGTDPSHGEATFDDKIGATGGGQSHENRPPFRALYFIEKISE